jgi:hypothetical protein
MGVPVFAGSAARCLRQLQPWVMDVVARRRPRVSAVGRARLSAAARRRGGRRLPARTVRAQPDPPRSRPERNELHGWFHVALAETAIGMAEPAGPTRSPTLTSPGTTTLPGPCPTAASWRATRTTTATGPATPAAPQGHVPRSPLATTARPAGSPVAGSWRSPPGKCRRRSTTATPRRNRYRLLPRRTRAHQRHGPRSRRRDRVGPDGRAEAGAPQQHRPARRGRAVQLPPGRPGMGAPTASPTPSD